MATNLWENADLESGIADWNDGSNSTISSDSSIYWEGAKSLKCVVPSNGTVEFRSDVKYIVEESTIYTVSAYWYVTNADLEMVIVVKDQGGSFINNGLVSGTADTWHRVTCAFQTGAGDTGIKIEFQKEQSAEVGDFYIDGIMLETGSSASTWVDYVEPGTDVAATSGAVVVAGLDATAKADTSLTATAGALTIASLGAAISAATTIAATAGAITLAALNPAVSTGTDINATAGAVAVSSYAATVSAGTTINVSGGGGGDGLWDIGAYIYPVGGGGVTISGNDATVESATGVSAGTGAVAVAGANPTVQAATSLTATTGAVVVAGANPTVTSAISVSSTAGALAVTGYAATVNAGVNIAVSGGGGGDGLWDIGAYIYPVGGGGVTISGNAATVQAGTGVNATTGAVTVAALGATVQASTSITSTTGALAVAGVNPSITSTTAIDATTGALVISGAAATVQASTSLEATTGALVIAALGTAVSAATTVAATAGTVAVADYNASVRQQVEGQFNMFYDLADHLGQQLHNFGGDTFKVGLIDGSIVPAQTSAAAWGTFSSSEVSGTGYSAGGVALSGASFNEASGTATFDATDTTFSYNAAGPEDARYAILYNDSDATTPKAAIGWLDLGTEVSLRDGDLVLQWAGDGIHQIAPV